MPKGTKPRRTGTSSKTSKSLKVSGPAVRRTKTSAAFSPQSKPIGILGGGQLARMLALKAHELGLPVSILSEKADDPAAQVVRSWIQGSLKDRKTLRAFLTSCSVVTFESEFLDADVLAELEKETGIPIYPRPSAMAAVQDRLSQKNLLIKNGLPTADFIEVNSVDDAVQAFGQLDGAVVFKKRRFGYDGYGTFVVRSKAELDAFTKSYESIPGREYGFIGERFVPFKRELAVMIARRPSGQTLQLPFVETYQQDSRCLWVKGPLQTPSLKKLGQKLERFLEAIDYAGVMGVELFDTGRGLVINELAPRVHNSGHYSLDALMTDQFSLHLKAICDFALDTPRTLAKGFAMYNLLGSKEDAPNWKLPPGVRLHWYGKSANRAGRKMGHVNGLGATPAAALALVKEAVRQNFDL